MRLRVLAAVTVLGAGCGSVSDNSNNPDAAIDATDMRPPMIAGSRPDMGEKGVSPLSGIAIRFDENLDMSTVSTATVKAKFLKKPTYYDIFGFLRFENVGGIEGTVSYVPEERKIVFVPLQPLPFNSQIDVTLDGVKDMGGVAMPPTHLTFDVLTNVDRYWTSYTNNGGTIYQVSNFFVMNGLQTRISTMNSPGPDQVWFTADDVGGSYAKLRADAQGRLTVLDLFNAGVDGIYGNADDVETGSYTFTYDAAGHLSSLGINSGIGPDNMWGTADDIPTGVIGVIWQGDSFIGWIQYNSPGLDGVWRTSDDRSSATNNFTKYQYDMQGHRTRQIDYQPGPDQLNGTADDVTLRYFDLTNDSHGFATQSVRKDKGADNMWFTGDDVTTGYIKYTRDARGLVTETLEYLNAGSAGADTMFMTGDDVASSRSTSKYSAAGQLVEDTPYYNAGTDAVLGNADDVPGSYSTYGYQTNGARTLQTFFSAPGVDAMWKTADDVYNQINSYDVLH
ncbi:MAG TPA: Ig-like domain-containing protein [Kofleriaceae bacterium]|nr:Ig-like domain-containing protein [Kofleriaceae bacterium]